MKNNIWKICALFWIFLSSFNQKTYQSTDGIDSAFLELKIHFNKGSDSTLLIASNILTASKSINYKKGQAKALTEAGLFLLTQYRLDTAYECLNSSKEIFEKNSFFGDLTSHEYGRLLRGYGSFYMYKRDFDRSYDYLILSLGVFEKIGDTTRIKNVLTSLGINRGMQSKFAEALPFFIRAYTITQDSASNSTILSNIAMCYHGMGQSEKAAQYFKSGLSIDIAKNWKAQVYKQNNLLAIYNDLNKIDSAIYYGESALDAARKFNESNAAVVALANLAQMYVLKENFTVAEAYAKEAELVSDSLGIVEVNPSIDFVKASIFNLHGEIDSTLFYSKRGLKSALIGTNKSYASRLSKLLADNYELLGKYDSSLHYFKIHHAMEDSLFNKKNQSEFTRLYAQMETLEKQNEIDLLRKQKEIEEAKRKLLIVAVIGTIILSMAIVVVLILRHRNKKKSLLLKEVTLKSEIEKKEQQLQHQTLHMINLNNSISDVEEKLREVKKKNVVSSQDVQRVLSNITISKSMAKEWKQFESYFTNIHPKFNDRLLNHSANLTHQERRLAVLIKMDLSNREISNLLNIEAKSVSMSKYRLKKKLGLSDSDDLTHFIQRN